MSQLNLLFFRSFGGWSPKNPKISDGSWRFFSKSWRRAAFDDVALPDMASSQPGPTLCWSNHGFLTRCSIARLPSSDWWQKNSKIFSTQPVIFQHMLLSLGFSKEPSSWIDQLHLPRTGFGTLRGCVGTLFTVLHRGCGIQSWWVHNCVTKAIACSEGLNHHKSIFAFGAGPPSTNTILGLEHVRWLVKWGTTVT